MKKIINKTIAILIFTVSINFAQAQEFTLKSNDLQGQLTNEQVLSGFGCTGENISPQLFWENIPKGTKSFAITVYDADAPTGSGWWHWTVFNIPANTKEIKKNAGDIKNNLMPKGSIQGRTDFGSNGFGGACPPEGHGEHTYVFTVYALDVKKLDLDENTPPAMVGYFVGAHTIKKASIISYYKR